MPDYTEPTNITTDSSTGPISVRFPHGVVTWYGRGKDAPPPLRVRGLVGVKGISNALAANPDITQGQIEELKSMLLTPSKGSIRRAFTNGILATAHEIIALGGDAIHTLWGGGVPWSVSGYNVLWSGT